MTGSMRLVRTRRKGLTLMELVVVLAILAALAAIVIPLFPNLLRRAHKSTDATQTNEVSKLVQLYQALYIGYPEKFDSLTDGTTFPGYLPGGATAPFGGFVQLRVPTAAEAEALHKVGINSMYHLKPGATLAAASGGQFHPTMWPYVDTPVAVSIQNTSDTTLPGTQPMAFLSDNIWTGATPLNPRFLAALHDADPTATYVVFGVGALNSMVGRNMQDAPTSVPQESGFTPDNTYCRVGLIFQVSGQRVAAGDNRALFVCACALEDDELETTEKDIVGYYQVAAPTP